MTKAEILAQAKPINFTTKKVQATLENCKSVDRQVAKPHKPADLLRKTPNGELGEFQDCNETAIFVRMAKPPYKIGDYLYVRETWGFDNHNWLYKADFNAEDLLKLKNLLRWHPSIHMPKEAARIFLKVTNVRVERLQDITAQDIKKEGLTSMCVHVEDMEIAQLEFSNLWDSVTEKLDYFKYSWNANPWVWVIEFERVVVE